MPDKIKKLYSFVIEQGRVSLDNLFHCGFTKDEVLALEQSGVLCKTESHEYVLHSSRLLALYETKKVHQQQGTCDYTEYLFLKNVLRSGNYVEAFTIAQKMIKTHPEDAYTFMYLLSYCGDLPMDMSKMALEITEDDMTIRVEDCKANEVLNDIGSYVFRYKLKYAYTLAKSLNCYTSCDLSRNVCYLELLEACLRKSDQLTDKIQEFLNKNDNEGLLLFLEDIYQKRNFSTMEEAIYFTVEDYVAMLHTDEPVVKGETEEENVFDAIIVRNYDLAAVLEEWHQVIRRTSVMDTLLLQLIYRNQEMISKLSKKKYALSTTVKLIGHESYDIANLDDLLHYIIENNANIYEACCRFELTNQQTNLVMLLFAHEFVKIGREDLGYTLLQEVKSNPYQSKTVKRFIEEVEALAATSEEMIETPLSMALKKVNGWALVR